MTIEKVIYTPIGTIYSPFKELEGMPIQPVGAKDIKGYIHIKNEFKEGLKDLDGFSHIILIYSFHLSSGYKLHVKPFLDNVERGLFATRVPKRPNSIGISVVRLEKIVGSKIEISNVDILNGTPLLDIKPYVPNFDKCEDEKLCIGWFEDKYENALTKKSDSRFLD